MAGGYSIGTSKQRDCDISAAVKYFAEETKAGNSMACQPMLKVRLYSDKLKRADRFCVDSM